MTRKIEAEGFRLDINGLRAWAVAAVVLYHFGVPGVSGGFAGVDVFFVISGFLMAGIVCSGLDSGCFSLGGFYLARARRILPALIVLVLAVLVMGWFLLLPGDYQMLGRHARESLLFTSNYRYLSEAGYFDTASHAKWLLHTWSLSVEWQFYLVYPLVLLVLARWMSRERVILGAHILALLISLAFCVLLTVNEPEKAFYWLPSRAWELLLGSCVYLVGRNFRPEPSVARLMELAGVALITVSIVFIDSSMPWPGALAVPPTLGAALLLLAKRQQSFWTGTTLAQWLGARSYSIYLWHWPLVVALAYFELQATPSWIGLGIVSSLVLGHLSFHWVENPSRRWLALRSNARAAIYLSTCLIMTAVTAQLVRRSGIPERLPEDVQLVDAERQNRNPRQDECLDDEARCVYGGKEVEALVFGDSHADALVTAVAAAVPTDQGGVYFRGVSSCPFVFGAKRVDGKGEGCERLSQEVLRDLPQLYPGKPVVLISRTTVYVMGRTALEESSGRPLLYFSKKYDESTPEFLEEFKQHYVDSVCTLSKEHPVYLLRPVPEMPVNVPKSMGREMLLGRSVEVKLAMADYHERHAFTWSMQDAAVTQCGARILDPLPYLCDETFCYGSRNGRPLYLDDDHLSERGNRKLIPMFAPIFAEGAPR
ncbi:acyltransferase 3 [Pseudomonas fulva 12-X]|uniref:Acyltransferase 3 n=2 Tax=Pseudomonas fulva TaxID=47880 RepID=F6AKQ6_PSEF1|nr:acyltransferase 3 [Pseudomonas fulva 12-X]